MTPARARLAIAAAIVLLVILIVTACAGGGTPAATTASRCQARPAPSGPVVVRSAWPGQPPRAMEFRDRWLWAPPAGGCVTSVTWLLAGTPLTTGCLQIGLLSQNPGYQAAKVPAPPLRKVAEQEGPDC